MKILKVYFFIIIYFTSVTFVDAIGHEQADSASKSNVSGIKFFKGTFKQALLKAKAEGKMVFIDSYTSWCRPCVQLKNDIFTNNTLGKYMNDNFVCMAVNIEKGEGPSLKRKYPHYTFPTMLYIKSDGKLKNRFVGMPTYGATELLNFAKLVTNNYN